MSTNESLPNQVPRWEAIVDEFLAETPVEVAFRSPRPTPNSIADPIGFMRKRNPKRAAEMQ